MMMSRDFMRNTLLLAPLVAVLSVTSGCYRGESNSLGEVVASARSAYISTVKSGVPAPFASTIEKTAAALDRLAGLSGTIAGTVARDTAREVGVNLAALIEHANPTVRPAMAELMKQYVVASDGVVEAGSPQIRLLVSRTYRLLAAEMTSSKFRH
jgi:hypothetical protein